MPYMSEVWDRVGSKLELHLATIYPLSMAIARLMFDRRALPDLRALAQSKPGSRNAELFSARLLSLANGGAGELRQSAAAR